MVVANAAFLLGSLALVSRKVRQILKMEAFIWFAASTVWLTSVIQTLLDHGDNPRFSVPTQSLVVFLVLWWSVQIIRCLVTRKT
jgi:hypothetical protein